MVKEAICPDVEDESAFALSPGCVRYRTPVIVLLRRSSLDGERAKAAAPYDCLRGIVESAYIQGLAPDKLVCAAKRGRCEIVCAYEVAIAARDRAIARVKLLTHLEGCRNPYIVWKNGVHRSSKRERAPLLRYAHTRSLATRVNPCIRPSGAYDSDRFSGQPRHRRLENTLNRPLAGLSLPAGKARAIVVQHQLHGTRQHPREITLGRVTVKERNPLEMIDFRTFGGQCATAHEQGTPSR